LAHTGVETAPDEIHCGLPETDGSPVERSGSIGVANAAK
jgi:hypothetical protein